VDVSHDFPQWTRARRGSCTIGRAGCLWQPGLDRFLVHGNPDLEPVGRLDRFALPAAAM